MTLLDTGLEGEINLTMDIERKKEKRIAILGIRPSRDVPSHNSQCQDQQCRATPKPEMRSKLIYGEVPDFSSNYHCRYRRLGVKLAVYELPLAENPFFSGLGILLGLKLLLFSALIFTRPCIPMFDDDRCGAAALPLAYPPSLALPVGSSKLLCAPKFDEDLCTPTLPLAYPVSFLLLVVVASSKLPSLLLPPYIEVPDDTDRLRFPGPNCG